MSITESGGGQEVGRPLKPIPIEIVSADKQVTLKQFVSEDAREMFDLIDRNRDQLSQFGDETSSKYPTYESALVSITHPRNPNRLRFAIRDAQGVMVGSINLTPTEDNPQRGEIGYWMGKESEGKGYMGRAVEALTDYGFFTLGYQTIFGEVVVGNDKSVNVLSRAGYKETQRHDNKIILEKQK